MLFTKRQPMPDLQVYELYACRLWPNRRMTCTQEVLKMIEWSWQGQNRAKEIDEPLNFHY